MTAVIPMALFGAHMYHCGSTYFSQLRTKIAEALLGDHHNIQPYLACMCLDSTLIDPELWLILHAIKEARHFLITAEESMVQKFYRMASNVRVRPAQVTGPAM